MKLNICHVSDNHNRYPILPECDLLIHSGDMTDLGGKQELIAGLDWLSQQKAEMRILVPGNHDIGYDHYHYQGPSAEEVEKRIQEAARYYQVDISINDFFEVDIKDHKFTVGTCSYQPQFCGWAFNMLNSERDLLMQSLFNKEPDIMIVHAPPYGCLDKDYYGERCGDMILAQIIYSRYKDGAKLPKYLFCGHIHESKGHEEYYGIKVYNSATTITSLEISMEDLK